MEFSKNGKKRWPNPYQNFFSTRQARTLELTSPSTKELDDVRTGVRREGEAAPLCTYAN